MRTAHVCFVLAVVSAVTAAGLATADTYPNVLCAATPVPPCMTQCGCPVPSVPNDFCPAAAPPAGQGAISYWQCTSGSPYPCTTPGLSCGGPQAVLCSCWTCGIPCYSCGPQPACTPTDPGKKVCGQLYGCTN
jgi:hypothetical protein